MKKKVVIIGLDGMPWHILQLLIDRGVMPNLKSVMKQGARGTLKSIIPPHTSPSWTSIATGVNPGKHGIFYFQHFHNRSYNSKLVDSRDIMYPRLHEMAMANGLKSVVINLPHSYPFLKSKKNIIITDWLTPEIIAYPDSIKHLVSTYKYSTNWDFDREIRLLELENRLIAIINLFGYTKWDIFFVVFSEPDWIMHMDYDAVVHYRKSITPDIHKCFSMIDNFIGHVTSKLNTNDLLMILSDHGFLAYDKIVHVNTILSHAGLAGKMIVADREIAAFEREPDPRSRKIAYKQKKVLLAHRISKIIRKNIFIRKIVEEMSQSKFIHDKLNRLALSYSVDFSYSKAFVCDPPFGIFVNSKRMFKYGIIDPEMEPVITDKIVKLLSRMRDPMTKHPLFSQVIKRDEVYWGPYVAHAPHILFIPNISSRYICSQKFYPEIIERRRYLDHSMYGVLMAYGNATRNNIELGVVNTYDLVPTVLHYLGLPVPFDTDGKILFRIFSESSDACSRPVKMIDYKERWRGARHIIKRTIMVKEEKKVFEDEERVKERLRKLGYL